MATLFTQQDFLDGKCKHQEIGTTHEPRWATVDADRGLCSRQAVGTFRQVVIPQGNLSPADVTQQALNQMGAAGLIEYLASRLDIMAPLVAKLGLNDIIKAAEPTKNLDELTDADLEAMSSTEIKRLMLASEGITTKSQVAALKGQS